MYLIPLDKRDPARFQKALEAFIKADQIAQKAHRLCRHKWKAPQRTAGPRWCSKCGALKKGPKA